MTVTSLFSRTLLCVVALWLCACSESNDPVASASAPAVLNLAVYKSPSCGCCNKWIDHLKDSHFEIEQHNQSNLSAFKAQHGIAPSFQSCHTGVSADGYVFEGHIPAKIIQQFLTEKPAGAIGLSVPGMPVGSPGMEMDSRFQPYQVLLLTAGGGSEIYAQINQRQEQY